MSLRGSKGYAGRPSAPTGRKSARNSYKKPIAPAKKISLVWPKSAKLPSLLKLKSFWISVLCIGAGGVVLAALCFGILFLYDTATSSEYFATQEMEVIGNKRLSKQMIRDISGVKVGDNSLDVSIAHMEQLLLETPWVETVSVKRVLPDKFIITVEEQLPVFWVRKNDVLFYADVQGNIIAPVVTEHFMALPTLDVEPGSEEALAKLDLYLEDLKSGYLPIEFGAISGVRITASRGMELYLDDREILLSIALDSWKKNLQRLSITIGDLVRRNELSQVREVRATDGNVWVIRNV